MDTKTLSKIGWFLALLPLWGPIVFGALVVLAAAVMVSPMIGVVCALVVGKIALATLRERA